MPITSSARLIGRWLGCISRSNVMPMATVLTSTGKKMIERMAPLIRSLGRGAQHGQGHAEDHLEAARDDRVYEGVPEALAQRRKPRKNWRKFSNPIHSQSNSVHLVNSLQQ